MKQGMARNTFLACKLIFYKIIHILLPMHNKCHLAAIQELKDVDVSRQDGEEI